MNTTEQILIRMGVDAKAVVTGLNKTSLLIKGWAASMKHEMTHGVGKLLAAGCIAETAKEMFGEISDKILAIKRSQEELGASSNFVQGLMLQAQKAGLAYESITRPLVKFSALIGKAKDGSIDARKKLVDLGIATKDTEWRSLRFSESLQHLQNRYRSLNAEQRNSLLMEAGMGRGFSAMSAILGGKDVSELEKGNFFTKMSEDTINNWQQTKSSMTVAGSAMLATAANTWNAIQKYSLVAMIARFGGSASTGFAGGWKEALKTTVKGVDAQKELADSEHESIEAQEEKVKILNEQNALIEHQKELQSQVTDRNKSSISEMAAHARKMLGIPEPRNYTVSVRDREALRIDTMEKQAKIAYEHGDDRKGQALTSEALQARAGFNGGTLKDRDPMGKTEVELARVNLQLEPVKRMADLINETHKAPK
jgi:hypothetical protein